MRDALVRGLRPVADAWGRRWRRAAPAPPHGEEGRRPATLVTGGSRGIGLALAHRFAAEGHALVLVARDAGRLAAASAEIGARHGVACLPLAQDLAAPDAVDQVAARVAAGGYYVDVLVNNAGIGLSDHFLSAPQSELAGLIAVNVSAPTALASRFLPGMLARGRGGVMTIASLGGTVPGPFQAAYYASKAYVVSLSEAVAWETRGRGVRVCVVLPGPVETSFHAAMGAEQALYRLLLPAMSPEGVARAAWRGYTLGRRVIRPGLLAPAMALALRLVPHTISIPLIGWLLKPRGAGQDAGSQGRRGAPTQ